MDTPSFKEDHISQIPALQMLQNLGFTYLSPAEADRLRGGKTSNVILDDILRRQLKEINAEKMISSTRTTYISDANIENGIRALKELPMNEGYITACDAAYNLMTLGKTFEQSFDGDKKIIKLCNKKNHFRGVPKMERKHKSSYYETRNCKIII